MGLIFIRLAVVGSNICEIPQNFEKGHPGHRSWCQLKAHMRLPISHYRTYLLFFRDIDV